MAKIEIVTFINLILFQIQILLQNFYLSYASCKYNKFLNHHKHFRIPFQENSQYSYLNKWISMEPTDLSIKKLSKPYPSRGSKKHPSRQKDTIPTNNKANLNRHGQTSGIQPCSTIQYSQNQYSHTSSAPRDVTNIQVRVILSIFSIIYKIFLKGETYFYAFKCIF